MKWEYISTLQIIYILHVHKECVLLSQFPTFNIHTSVHRCLIITSKFIDRIRLPVFIVQLGWQKYLLLHRGILLAQIGSWTLINLIYTLKNHSAPCLSTLPPVLKSILPWWWREDEKYSFLDQVLLHWGFLYLSRFICSTQERCEFCVLHVSKTPMINYLSSIRLLFCHMYLFLFFLNLFIMAMKGFEQYLKMKQTMIN